MTDYEINEERTYDLLKTPDTYKAKVFTCSENETPKKMLFSRNTPFSEESIEEALWNKGFRGQGVYYVIIYNKNDDEKICGGALLFNPRKKEEPLRSSRSSLAGDEQPKPKSTREVDSLMKMYQLGSENSINTMKQMQSLFGKTLEEQSRQNRELQQELIKTMKRQEREEKAREKNEKSNTGFNQMLGGFLPLLGQLAGNQQRINTPNFTPPPSNVKPFQPNRNIKTDRG